MNAMGLITYLDVAVVALFALIWIGIMAFLRFQKGKSLIYLLFFTCFYIYIVKVLDYTLFQFQVLVVLKHFVPSLILRGQGAEETINLIPLATLMLEDVKTSLLNILMMIPFGFGLPFITKFRMKQVVMAGLLVSISIESLQFLTGFLAQMTFRIADINDVIWNTVGVVVGYILFVGFVRLYRHIVRSEEEAITPLSRYIIERPQIKR